MDAKWFKERMQARDLNQTRLGELIGLDRSQFSKVLGGTRELSPQEAADLARVLAVPLDEVLRRAGVKVHAETRASVPVIGVADVSGAIATKFDGPKRIERPGSGYGDLSAVRIDAPHSPTDGWNAYFVPAVNIAPESVGRLSVVSSRVGRAVSKYLGVLERETSRGNWRVVALCSTSSASEIIDRAAIEWAAPVLWIQTNVA